MGARPRDGTLGRRLAQRRDDRFVGRQAEREMFESMLDGTASHTVLFVHGPGGVGKTSLLARFAARAEASGAPVAAIDGRAVPASVDALLDALGVAAPASVARDAPVVLVDSYERLESLDGWVRNELLPALPAGAVVVLAGRHPPSVAWRADAAWREAMRVIALRNLTADDSRRFLLDSGVPADHCDRLAPLTHGHPLALSLVADAVARGRDPGKLVLAPDVVAALVRDLVADVPDTAHRRALDVGAIARTTTEALLRDALDLDDARHIFDWLAELPFVETAADGLAPHDLARDVLDVDLRWRDRPTYDHVFRRVRAHIHGLLRTCRGVEQQRAIYDEKFAFRNLPSVLAPVDWRSWGDAYPEPARPDDRDAVLAIVSTHEGDESATIAAAWWDHQPEAFHVVREHGAVQGCLVLLTFSEEPAFDPGARAAWDHAANQAPPRAGEVVTQTRFVLDRDRYQDPSPTLNATPVVTMQRYLQMPNLAWDYLTLARPDRFDDYFAIADLPRAAGADFAVGGRRYGLFAHDFRRVPVDEWLDVVTERALAQELTPRGPSIDEPVVLSQPDFVTAVRQALRDLHRSDLLARNPLCRARLVRERSGAEPATVLADILHHAADDLRHHPRDIKRWRAIDRTYLRPASTQEQAAEVLDLPFSTYRRHLTEGVARIADQLWELELYGAPDVGREDGGPGTN